MWGERADDPEAGPGSIRNQRIRGGLLLLSVRLREPSWLELAAAIVCIKSIGWCNWGEEWNQLPGSQR